MRYGPQAQEVFDYLRRTPAAQAQLRAPIYEDKVVDLCSAWPRSPMLRCPRTS